MRRALVIGTFQVGLLLTAATPVVMTAAPSQAYGELPDLRGLIDRVQTDLRSAADLERGDKKQHDRYRDAQKSLSDLDRQLTKGHLDHGKMDDCIDHLKAILDHNTLQASSRDELMRDVEDLRIARDHFRRD